MKASQSLQNDQSTATEDALRRAVDTTPAFIHTARPDGYIDYFNRGWLDFFGKSLEDVCGWRWTETVHPEDVAAIVQKWHAALASGEPFEIESRVRRADGSYRALLHRKLPLRDEHGNIVKWFGSSIDIEDGRCAERRIAEKTAELQRNEFYLREGERLAHMGSWSLRPDGIFDYWSPETFSIFGFDPSEGIPTLPKWLTVLHPDDRDLLAKTIEKMFRESVRGDVTYRVDHPKQGKRIMHSTGDRVVGILFGLIVTGLVFRYIWPERTIDRFRDALRPALRQLARLLEIPRPDISVEKAKTEAHALIPETSRTFEQARRYAELTTFELEESPNRDRTSLGDLESTLSHAEDVFTAATLLASEQAWNEWQQLSPDTKIAESELRNAAAKRIEDATTNYPAKDLDHANLSIALTRWNETMVRPAPYSRAALVSQIAAEAQDLG